MRGGERRGRAPEESDERRLGAEVRTRRSSGRAAEEARLVLRAVERKLGRADDVDRIALVPPCGDKPNVGTSPTQPTTGVGWIAAPSVSL